MSDATVRAGRRRVAISHADRVVFPEAGLSKLDLARHYADVGPVMVPHVRGRPLALQVFPRGIGGDGHFLKDTPRHFPGWVRTATVPKREGGTIDQVLADDVPTLVYLAGQNAVTPHVWTARADRLERPDRVIFDLDPSGGSFDAVRAAARAAGGLLRELGLVPFAMTTGSRGLHVVAPLRRTAEYDEVHAFAREAAAALAEADREALTVEFRKAKRGDRIYVDVARNAYGQHAVAPYAVRALPAAPVATPLRWEELDDDGLRPQGWTVATIGERLADLGDPWAAIARHARAVGPARRALGRRATRGSSRPPR
jgi:bifunctional non-homologous end joining protein LigD